MRFKESSDEQLENYRRECEELGPINSNEKSAALREIYLKYFPYVEGMKEYHENKKQNKIS